jgi:hypothetical protein
VQESNVIASGLLVELLSLFRPGSKGISCSCCWRALLQAHG